MTPEELGRLLLQYALESKNCAECHFEKPCALLRITRDTDSDMCMDFRQLLGILNEASEA